MDYLVLAYYFFTPIEDPILEVARHKEFLSSRDIKCRVYLSKEGINGQMSAGVSAASEYMEWLKGDFRFADVEFKIHKYSEHCFPRVVVKARRQLVALDADVDMDKTGKHLSAQEWDSMLEERDENTLLIDVRNDYEWRVGHFEGAELPSLDQFRQFPSYAQELATTRDIKNTRVMMYCTGGIRCELYSALLKEKGFEEVYQLDGGVIKYGLQENSQHWRGKLFVFDDRLAVPINEKNSEEVISTCIHCGKESDIYCNCANMDCNDLYISCLSCAQERRGCCCISCESAPRVRSFEATNTPKPYRRLVKGDGNISKKRRKP
jgi:UPF0176 protein